MCIYLDGKLSNRFITYQQCENFGELMDDRQIRRCFHPPMFRTIWYLNQQ